MKFWNPKMQSKMSEALSAVVPVIVIVLALSFTVAPVSPSILLSFLMGAVLVMVGMMFFTLGAEISMTPMGEKVGAKMTQTKNVWFIILISFVLAFLVPGDFRAIAFDSGGVTTGPMTVPFIMALGVGISAIRNDRHAAGGTVIHAKGTGTHLAEKFMGMTLVPEKEMIFIVVRKDQKNDIMRAIMEQAGTGTRAGAIVFSLPVTDTAGMRMMEEIEEE